jgi:hypothetical protein
MAIARKTGAPAFQQHHISSELPGTTAFPARPPEIRRAPERGDIHLLQERELLPRIGCRIDFDGGPVRLRPC